ncbi:MAG: sporulation integral membrane protein YtvI [Roseburia sp.]|nr:sporulation integral membrane protein YtvI [Roseburia sp.]
MEKKKKFIVNIVYYSIIAVLVLLACKYVVPAMLPFIAGFIIASILHAPVSKLAGKNEKLKHLLSIVFCVAFYIIISLLITYAGVKLVSSISKMVIGAPAFYQNEIVPALEILAEEFEALILSWNLPMNINIDAMFEEHVGNLGEYISTFSVNAVKFISGGIVLIPGTIVKIILMIVSSFFFVVDYDMIMNFFIGCIPESKKGKFENLRWYVKNTLLVYIRSYSLLFFLTFVELTIGFSIMRIPYAPVIALIVAIFDILPVLGTGGILLPWAIILFILENIPLGIGMIVLYLAITIIRNTIEPKIVGAQIGLHPLATLISMIVGLELFGFAGMIGFPVSLAVLTNMKQKGMKS